MSTGRTQFDQQKAEEFAGKFVEALNHGALCLMASVGHRTGLFDHMREMPPATSDEIAERA
ncbi:MAG TPA: transcriptional regulator, partial [Terriglobia bacterium]|nr:transcriptional regulator [Terriglobia bacterium]